MNLPKPIGGYLQLEFPRRGNFLNPKAIFLNSGRSCLGYILRANNAAHVYVPKYTCEVVIEPLEELNIPYTFYQVNKYLEIETDIKLKDKEFILYTNYFGVKDSYCNKLSIKYKNALILDCSQAFYFPPLKYGHTFYSPRKFFGLPDGGILFTRKTIAGKLPTDISYKRFSHLIKRIDLGAEAAYQDFKKDDKSLSNQPIKQMSVLTKTLLQSINTKEALKIRVNNFDLLHKHLKETNQLKLANFNQGAMCYPYMVDYIGLRKKLIDKKIFVPTYWPNIFEWCDRKEFEYELAEKIMPLPIDQRYRSEDMRRILEAIDG